MFLLTGCASDTTLPFCGNPAYTKAMAMYLKDDPDLEQQYELMNRYFAAVTSSGRPAAPGAYAFMGLLYSKKGDPVQCERYLELEKQHFPESGHYIEFVKNKARGKVK